jgi:hypothetical protein
VVATFPRGTGIPWVEVTFFIALTAIAEAMPVVMPRGQGSASVSFAIVFTAILTWGPGIGSLVAAVGTMRLHDFRRRTPIEVIAFNRAQLALSAAACGLTFQALGGVPGRIDALRDLPALLLGGLAYFAINMAATCCAMVLLHRVSARSVWTDNLKWVVFPYVAITPLGIVLAAVYQNVGVEGILLFFIPLMAARYSFQLYSDMRRIYLSTIEALVRSIEARDPYTSGHSTAVREYTLAVARRMKLPDSELERLEYVSLLHDIGKIAIPDAILLKKGRLTPDEYELVKTHPQVGATIVGEVPVLGDAVGAVRHHHEWYNGSGYPGRLEREGIPLTARILAVADAFDAMTSDRPYKKAYSYQDAVRELTRCAGQQFDPIVVGHFLAAVTKVIPKPEVPSQLEAPSQPEVTPQLDAPPADRKETAGC